MQEYLDLLEKVKNSGKPKGDRTGTGTISVFGHQMRFNLEDSFPLLTTKKIHFKSVAYELLWFLKGDTNINYLKENGVSIWDEWADENGDLGPVYGKQWRKWEGKNNIHDQVTEVIKQIKDNPDSRRHIVSAWNVADIPSMALAPCHILFQFYVQDGKLSCQLYQRSADIFLGVPFNIASYSFLTCILAKITGYKPGKLIHILGDTHIYEDHIDAVKEQIQRVPYQFPELILSDELSDIDNLKEEYFTIKNYTSYPKITATMIA